ncbi:hypothetical protein GFL15_24740 [Rhizobium leguminosarum bv. viciae]|nr:hypothetical protein [Rhizobium leguminosarum bv. viciae]
MRERNNFRLACIPFHFIIYSHVKYTIRLRVLGCNSDMGMIAHNVTVSVDARVDTPVMSDRAAIPGPADVPIFENDASDSQAGGDYRCRQSLRHFGPRHLYLGV